MYAQGNGLSKLFGIQGGELREKLWKPDCWIPGSLDSFWRVTQNSTHRGKLVSFLKLVAFEKWHTLFN
jgi:hypothetical protein